jgi:hypothetical protein
MLLVVAVVVGLCVTVGIEAPDATAGGRAQAQYCLGAYVPYQPCQTSYLYFAYGNTCYNTYGNNFPLWCLFRDVYNNPVNASYSPDGWENVGWNAQQALYGAVINDWHGQSLAAVLYWCSGGPGPC